MSEGCGSSPQSPDLDPIGSYPEGSLTFVGAGPGDPDLLTMAGAKALQGADIVMVDGPDQLSLLGRLGLPREPEILTASDAEHDFGLLHAQVMAGKDVVRLVGGDLFLDADSALLARALAAPGLRVDVVPGVSGCCALASYVGIQAGSWAYLDAVSSVPEVWPETEALVIRTVCARLAEISKNCPRDPNEPILAVTRVGTTTQASEVTTWAEIGTLCLDGPAYLLAGPAIARRNELDWFSSKPLFDWRILVPVANDQGGAISSRAAFYGALPQEVPTMSIEPPRSEQQMEKAVRGLVDGRYKWIVFTSPNAVEGIRARFIEYGLDARAMSGIEIAAVGNATAKALAAWGLSADLMPAGQQTSANLAASFPAFDDMLDPINRVLVPRAEISTDALLAGLEGIGWEVEDVTAYRTVRASPPPAETREAIKTGLFDAVLFASSSTVRNLIGIAGKPHTSMVVVAIGAATAKTCEEHGLRVDAIAAEPTTRSLVDTLADFARARRTAQLAAGEPVTKPSQKRRRRRRSAQVLCVDA